MPNIILFDIDGTLLLSGGAGRTALNAAFLELHGWTSAMQGVAPAGRTDLEIVDLVFRNHLDRSSTEEERSAVLRLYVERLRETVPAAEGYRLMPGIPELLADLSGRDDVALGLATGNIEAGAGIKLGRARLDRFFSFGGFADDAYERIELTRVARDRGLEFLSERSGEPRSENVGVWVVGDSVYDVRCGLGIGAKTLAVATGFVPRMDLEAERPHLLFDDLSDTEHVVGALTTCW